MMVKMNLLFGRETETKKLMMIRYIFIFIYIYYYAYDLLILITCSCCKPINVYFNMNPVIVDVEIAFRVRIEFISKLFNSLGPSLYAIHLTA